jgi:MinD-like ATPase involved in chromosome partitioning or flagellar assembly
VNQISILIASCDIEYGTILGKTLANQYPTFCVTVMDAEVMECSKIELHVIVGTYDVILLDENWKRRLFEIEKEYPNIIGLCEESASAIDREGYYYKYAGVLAISAEIQTVYATITGKSRIDHCNLQTDIIGVTSATGGVGKTTVAFAIARELSSYHNCKVLYLSLEDIESTAAYLSIDNGKCTISDYLYYLFSEREEHISSYPDVFLLTDECGVDVFRPSKGMNELKGLSKEKMSYFLGSVCSHMHYHYICLDFDADLSEQSAYLVNICQKVLIIDDGRPPSIYKNNKLINYLGFCYGENFKHKILKVRNKWSGEIENLPGPEAYVLEDDSESFQYRDGYIEMNMNRSFGLGVKKLAKEIREKV